MGIFTKKSAQAVAETQSVPHQAEAAEFEEIPPGAIITDEVDETPLAEGAGARAWGARSWGRV